MIDGQLTMVVINAGASASTARERSSASRTIIAIAVVASVLALAAIAVGLVLALRRCRRADRVRLPSTPTAEIVDRRLSAGPPRLPTPSPPPPVVSLGIPVEMDDDTVIGPVTVTRPPSWSEPLPDLDALHRLTRESASPRPIRATSSRFSFERST